MQPTQYRYSVRHMALVHTMLQSQDRKDCTHSDVIGHLGAKAMCSRYSITTAANALAAKLHGRMPGILPADVCQIGLHQEGRSRCRQTST